MSSSRHPVALSVERRVGSSARLLAVVMCLPLVDGVFVAVVLGGALETLGGILEVGLLVFAGSATVAVILAEMDAGPREQARIVLGVGSVVIGGAAVQATLAPTIESLLNMAIFERFAALVVLGVAASTASARLDEYLPGPPVVLGLGLVASLEPAGASLALQTDPGLIARAVAAAGVGVLVALGVAVASPWLRTAVEIDRFRFGSAVALGVLALSVAGFVPSSAPVALAVLLVTALLAFDPGEGDTPLDTDAGVGAPADTDPVADTDTVSTPADTATGSDADVSAASSDAGTESGADVQFVTDASSGGDAGVHPPADVDVETGPGSETETGNAREFDGKHWPPEQQPPWF
jgi:hypothetical protein